MLQGKKIKTQFNQDLEKLYKLVKINQDEINSYFHILTNANDPKRKFIDEFITQLNLEINPESRYSVVVRLVQLREESLTQLLKSLNKDEKEIIEIQKKSYQWVKKFYLSHHLQLLKIVEEQNLLTPFYRTFLQGVHQVGIAFSAWQPKWTAHIIDDINPKLYTQFDENEPKIYEMLNEKKLYDLDQNGNIGDRSYSVLVEKNGEFKSLSYQEAFKDEVDLVITELNNFINSLADLEDEIYNQKNEILKYLQALVDALSEKNSKKLISKWAEVDKKWMAVTIPLQIGHPLEYYEDKYRKAVALEWDLRITNPNAKNADFTKNNIINMFNKCYQEIAKDKKTIFDSVHSNLNKTSLFLSRPMLFYGAEFNGLFSAQVVPNDENVSKEFGKKIFAFGDNVLDSLKSRPKMKIDDEIFPAEFLENSEKLLRDETLWHKIYDITTIGHEFGHILWCEEDSEAVMNQNGNFKNIEEFKATTGGLMAYFENSDPATDNYILNDTVKRAVKLISWMEVGEVEAYYVEGLIHLTALFETGVLRFNQNLEIDSSAESFKKLQTWYEKTYKKLAITYLEKKDADEFLKDFVVKNGKIFKPINQKVNNFVDFYYTLYQKIGRETA